MERGMSPFRAGLLAIIIVAVAALNIVASLILLVMEKTRDIAILKTMGASARSVRTPKPLWRARSTG